MNVDLHLGDCLDWLPTVPDASVDCVITDPPYRVSRALTAGRVPERWLWLVSLVWLFASRVLASRLYVPGPAVT